MRSLIKKLLLTFFTLFFLCIKKNYAHDFSIFDEYNLNQENNRRNIEIINNDLSTNLSLESYDIYLSPHLDPAHNFTYDGIVKLKLRVLIATDQIVLSYGKITIQSITATNNQLKLNIIEQKYDERTENYRILLDTILKVGDFITIEILFYGQMTDDATGFYKKSYSDVNENLKWIAATQLTNLRMRDVFPCFDELKQTTNIEINILRSESQITATNTALNFTRTIPEGKMLWDVYNSREPVLLNEIAIFIADYSSIEETQIQLNKWATINSNGKRETTSALNSLSSINKVLNEKINETINDEKYRLPITVTPNYYKLTLHPYITPNNFTFDGVVEIKTKAEIDTTKITLHSNEIEHHEINLIVNSKPMKNSWSIDEKYHFLSIVTNEAIVKGSEVNITIKYTGILNTAMRGFYRSWYTDVNNTVKWLVATHLEPVGARNMFPCFDEPALKAKFQLNVIRSSNYSAISNTPLTRTIKQGNDFLDSFEETPTMSTYLVALVVSDFKFNIVNNKYSAYARPNVINQTIYATTMMEPIVDYFEKALNHSYQLRKLDMIALPDFASGAMENWGLITYRESNMLYDPEHSPIVTKQSIASVIAHEIAHQWFGNLVSPQWWKYAWLSEGFARYYQYHATAKIETDWGLENQFVIEQHQNSFGIDGESSSHPMTYDVYSPSEISQVFDQISYGKGGSVLRMMEKIIGPNSFNAALHDYLQARQYQDATPEHLYNAFQTQVNNANMNLSVKEIMDSWTTQPGFPVVNVNINGNTVKLSQKRFLLKNPNGIDVFKLWSIPITYAAKSNPDFYDTKPKSWLKTIDSLITINDIEIQKGDWIIFNVQEAGYYRVNYDIESWYRIITALKSKYFEKIHEVNRAALMDDILNLARAGDVDYFHALTATQYLTQETNYLPWKAALNSFSYLNKQFAGKSTYDLFKVHMLTILTPIYNKLGFNEINNENHYDKLLRRNVINWACELGMKDCIEKSLKSFANWKSDSSKLVPVNLRTTIYCTAIKYGTVEDYDFLWNKYLTTDVIAERSVIVNALGCTKNTTLLKIFLTSAIDEKNSPFRYQDIGSVFSSVYTAGLFGAENALNFVINHYDDMYKFFGDYSDIVQIVSGISNQLTTKQLVLQLQKFVEENSGNFSTVIKSLNSIVTRAHEELTWYDNNSPRIFEWLDTTYPKSGYRLPKSINPISYTIFLTPYLENNKFTFDGSVTIRMNINENITSIVLHAHELTINDIEVLTDTARLDVSSYTINSTTEKLTIYLTTTVNPAISLTVNIQYSGILNNKMVGFYRSYYQDNNGTIHWLASTQFQKFGARQAFPCFDEPAFKAKFTVNIERPSHYHTLSNMPLRRHGLSNKVNHTWDYYMESEHMSSYLVAFIVSDFAYVSNDNGNFKVWSRPNAKDFTKNALDVGVKALSYLEKYTGISYPISKMDFAAIPDFAAGAMENWGLVTFREYGLLTSENVTAAVYMRYMTETIAHELVHMWFGDLVTCDWWEYVWLNEGFAEYLAHLVVDYINPEWNMEQHFISYELQVALLKDSFPHMRPMNNKMTTPFDEGKDFSSIAYAKSASVIHMMHCAFGKDIFAKGLHTYLDQNKYKTSKPEYLWSAMQFHIDANGGLNSTNESVATLMDSWASQPGYPVVHANLSTTFLTLTQERFLVIDKNDTNSKQLYWIPITIASKKNPKFTNASIITWFGKNKIEIPRPELNNEWFLLNVQQSGYYRVNYETDNWNKLIAALNEKNYGGIPEINRAQIIDDILNLARAEYVSYDLALIATEYLSQELHHLPWKAFFSAYTYLHERFNGHEAGLLLEKYILKLTENVYKNLTFNGASNDTQLTKTNRQLILSWVCKLNHNDCVETSKKLFAKWRNDTNTLISADAKPAIICTALKHGNYDDWNFAWKQYLKSNFESDKLIILNSLGCTQNTTAINQYLNATFSRDGSIRDQNVATAFSSIHSAGNFGVNATLQYLITNYSTVYKYYGNWNMVAKLFSDVATKFSIKDQINRLQQFVNNTSADLKEIATSLNTIIKEAEIEMEFSDKHGNVIKNLLLPPVTTETNGNNGGNGDGNSSNKIDSTVSILISIFTVLVVTFH